MQLTNGQFSLLMSLNRAEAPSIGSVVAFLAMGCTTLTANLKPLERPGLVTVDAADRRSRLMTLPPVGHNLRPGRCGSERRRRLRTLSASHCWDRLPADLHPLSQEILEAQLR